MGCSTGVEVAGDDAVVVKRASGRPEAIEALRAEGDRLRRAAHPGVVSVVRSEPTVDGWELVLAHGGRSLATVDEPSVADAAAIVASLASTTADLHDIGITHGRIEASHVVLSDGGHPRLCGFGPGRPSSTPADDVAALGALLEQLLGGVPDAGEPIPDRRWARARRWRGWERRALLLLADQATAEDPSTRPTARRLAAAIAAAVPDADREAATEDTALDALDRLPPPSEERRGGSPRRGLPVVLAGLGAVLALAAVPRLHAPERPPGTTVVDHERAAVEVATPVSGSVVVQHGQRYRVGQDGDHLLVADWSCDGRPTPAVFRPSTHEVFVFERWTVSEPLAVRPVATVDDAVEMVADRSKDGCPELAVRTSHGGLVPVALDGVR